MAHHEETQVRTGSAYLRRQRAGEDHANEVERYTSVFEHFDEHPNQIAGKNRVHLHRIYQRLLDIAFEGTSASRSAIELFVKYSEKFGSMGGVLRLGRKRA